MSAESIRIFKPAFLPHFQTGANTFKSTSKGTIAKLTDTRLFEVNELPANEHNDGPPTNAQRTDNEPATTNSERKKDKKEKKESERGTPARAAIKSNCPPDLKDVIEHGKSIDCSEEEANNFFNYYAARGWMMKAGMAMRDFRAALSRWMKQPSRDTKSAARPPTITELKFRREELEKAAHNNPAQWNSVCSREDRAELRRIKAEIEKIDQQILGLPTTKVE